MTSGRPKLGDVFRGESPNRTEGLAGLLPPGPTIRPVPARPVAVPQLPDVDKPAAPENTESGADAAQTAAGRGSGDSVDSDRVQPAPDSEPVGEAAGTALEAPPRRLRKVTQGERQSAATRPRRDEPTPKVRDTTIKMVPANIDVTVHQELRRFATRTELSFATIALRAIEANAGELAELWRTPVTPARTGLFGSVQERPGNRRAEPAAQVQLRLQAADAAVLDGLVGDWVAPSRSALVNEALKRYLATSNTPAT